MGIVDPRRSRKDGLSQLPRTSSFPLSAQVEVCCAARSSEVRAHLIEMK